MEQEHPRFALMQQALAHAREPQDARVMLTHLLVYAEWRHIEQALQKVHHLQQLAAPKHTANVVRLAELEAERSVGDDVWRLDK